MSEVLVIMALAVWFGAAIRLGIIDHRTQQLPTRLIWFTAGIVWLLYSVVSIIEGRPDGLVGAFAGALTCGVALAVIHFFSPLSIGFGDVRLSVLNGLLCGWWGWSAAFAHLAVGFVVAFPSAVIVLQRYGTSASRPFGCYLIVGATVVWIWGVVSKQLVPFG
ncbi:MAG: hypothetical protein OXI96_05150 [Acidimicrobiaceae bacterium]|nr:hypothetical protein [Acidimicrobiaceae bacterium]